MPSEFAVKKNMGQKILSTYRSSIKALRFPANTRHFQTRNIAKMIQNYILNPNLHVLHINHVKNRNTNLWLRYL